MTRMCDMTCSMHMATSKETSNLQAYNCTHCRFLLGVARILLGHHCEAVNEENCVNFTRRTFSYLPRCISQQDIFLLE